MTVDFLMEAEEKEEERMLRRRVNSGNDVVWPIQGGVCDVRLLKY